MANSLLGRADTALVQAATKAAMANVPKDLSRVHERLSRSHAQTMRSIGRSWVQGITGAAKIGGKLIKQAQQRRKTESELWVNSSDFETKGVSGIDPSDKTGMVDVMVGGEIKSVPAEDRFKYDALSGAKVEYKHTDITGNTETVKPRTVREHLKDIRNEYVSLGWRGDKDAINPATGIEWTKEQKKVRRDELKTKKDRLRASAVEFQTYKAVMKEQLAQNNINIDASDPIKMQFAQALLGEGKPLYDVEKSSPFYGSRAIMGFGDKGDMTFTYVDRYGRPIMGKDGKQLSIQRADIGELLVPKNIEVRTSSDLAGDKAQHFKAGKAGKTFDGSGIASMVKNEVVDVNTFRDLSNYLGPNTTQTLTSALHGVEYVNGEPVIGTTEMSAAFWGELKILGDEWDTDLSGTVDAKDFANIENYDKLKDYILDGKDLNLSKKIIETHLVNEAKGYHKQGLEQYKTDKNVVKAGQGLFDLPWQENIPLPTTDQGKRDRVFVQSVINENNKVTIGDDVFELQDTGRYVQTRGTARKEEGEYVEAISKGEFTKTNLIQLYGGLYKNIPNDFFPNITDYISPTTFKTGDIGGEEGALN